MDNTCPSCREPLDCPSGDGCAAMTKHTETPDALNYLTLDTDELGIWLVDETPEGPQQMGHISWKEITQGVQNALIKDKFLLALAKIDEEEGWFDE